MRASVLLLLAAAACSPSSESVVDAPPRTIARVLGDITSDETGIVDSVILDALRDDYAKSHNIEPTEEEIVAYIAHHERESEREAAEWERIRALAPDLDDPTLEGLIALQESLREREGAWSPDEKRERLRDAARTAIRLWKFNRALFEEHGGRVSFESEPHDATVKFLHQRAEDGAFEFFDDDAEYRFWESFTYRTSGLFRSPGDAREVIETPEWMATDTR